MADERLRELRWILDRFGDEFRLIGNMRCADMKAAIDHAMKAEQERDALRLASVVEGPETAAVRAMRYERDEARRALADRDQQIAALRDELKDLRAAMFNIAVATIRDLRGAVMPQDVVSAVVDVAANRQWLLDEHVPSLQSRIDAIEADVVEQVSAFLRSAADHLRDGADDELGEERNSQRRLALMAAKDCGESVLRMAADDVQSGAWRRS